MGKHAKRWDGEQYLQDILQSEKCPPRIGAHLSLTPSAQEMIRNTIARLDIEDGEWVE